jgi:hypothetical protein
MVEASEGRKRRTKTWRGKEKGEEKCVGERWEWESGDGRRGERWVNFWCTRVGWGDVWAWERRNFGLASGNGAQGREKEKARKYSN